MEVDVSKVDEKEAKESLIYYGNVGDINHFIDENYSKIYQDDQIVSDETFDLYQKELERQEMEESSKKKN